MSIFDTIDLYWDLYIKEYLCKWKLIQWLAGDCACCAFYRGGLFVGLLWLMEKLY